MAEAASFDESNLVLGKPEGMTDDECTPLSVLRMNCQIGPVVFSCWKFNAEELEEIIKTKRVWLGVLGTTMPPVIVSGTKPFKIE